MNSNTIIIIVLILLSIIEIFVFVSLKQYNETKRNFYFISAIIFYVLIAYLLVYSFNYEHMAIVNAFWNGISIISISLIGYYFFQEALTINEITAMILVVIAIIIVAIDK
ncbi:hypothetical protein QJ857_gp0140 [Tupanvirus soda lake]|uniref:Uncharacterized protein n=2 Tax=Tupanvirus TaxID=2094720 RepID=A0A6N1NNE0_9VIRU|nr:hypothetical protein QJ857_gp0140 [Tupanvirus soda lake]QKU35884.1 hypothetical protein [Tupanvirus soda lake]